MVYPDTQRGIQGLWIFTFICMQITAPMKKEISSTMGIESTPNCDISLIYRLANMRIRSGTLNERPIRMRYLPKVVRYFFNNLIINIGLMSVLRCKSNQKRSKNYHVYNSFLVFSV